MRYKCLKKSTFVVFYNILTVMYSLLRMNSRLQLTFENDIIHSLPNKNRRKPEHFTSPNFPP